MAFTKQHYTKIAEILADARKDARNRQVMLGGTQPMLDRITTRLADMFAEDNERFDYDRFWNAADPMP